MRIVLQRVSQASVVSDGVLTGRIDRGFLVLIGIEQEDTEEDARWLSDKVTQMRLFPDMNGKMNLSIEEVHGQFLVISQFTLHASIKKGNRPSFIKAARPEKANELYVYFKNYLGAKSGFPIASGIFGANMEVSLINDGPVTIIIDSRNKE